MLHLANEKDIDLENFCFYCKIIKSTRTFHCNYCKTCIEKFDHHCVYINNCLGHKNHKFFILFLITIGIYFLCSTTVCVIEFATNGSGHNDALGALDWSTRIYTILMNVIQSIPLM